MTALGEIVHVQRNGDFQTVTFADGSTVWTSSEQDSTGNWIDGRGVENVIAAAGYDESKQVNR